VIVVRYAALVALVVWLGRMILALAGSVCDQMTRDFSPIAFASGGVMLVCLLVMKFVGPPPRAFVVRTGIVSLMLLATAAAGPRRASRSLAAFNTALGLALLAWYARE
jgi:hypothetical protein